MTTRSAAIRVREGEDLATTRRRAWFVVSALLIGIAFAIGIGIGNSASGAGASGTSIPITKGGTGATTAQGALQNLLPNYTNNNGKVLGLSGGVPTWVNFPQRNDSITATSTYSFKGTRYVELGYSGSGNWNGQYKKFYHGEGVPGGSNNFVALKVKAASWNQAQYAEFLVRVDLSQNTSFYTFTVTPLVNTGASAITIPEFTLSGSATSFDIWLKGNGYGYTAELLTYDEVSANDTLLNEAPTTTAPTSALTTKTSGSWAGDNYSTTEVNTGGTWTDGKPIYRKVVSITINYTNTSFGRTNLGLTDIDSLVSVDGWMSWNAAFYSSNSYEGNKIPYASAMALLSSKSGNNAFLYVNSSKILYFDAQSTSANGQVVMQLVVEYTKV
jgi:hypothetical protein